MAVVPNTAAGQLRIPTGFPLSEPVISPAGTVTSLYLDKAMITSTGTR